jgi:uncharacterized membrane protein YeaQ/YmgE (transglycosylase-associated protein family)
MGIVLILLLAVIVLFLVGGFVIGFVLELLWLALAGLVIGALARLVLPGEQTTGVLGTILAGIGGSLLGGIFGDALDAGWFVTFLIAVAVAAGLIALLSSTRRTATI